MASNPTGGRAELERLLARQSARTQRLARQVAIQVAAAVAAGSDASTAVNVSMEAVGVAVTVRDAVATAVVQSLCVGAGIWPTVRAAGPEDVARWKATALGNPWDGSGMVLSATLHGTDAAMRTEIIDAVKANVTAAKTAWDAQRQIYTGYNMGGALRPVQLSELPKDLQGLVAKASKVLTPEDLATLKADAKRMSAYADRLATAPLKTAYKQMADRLEKGITDGLDALIRQATEEKTRYHASRILRTEAANAWGQGFHSECMGDTDCVGIKWNLSSSHKLFDICDFNHTADLYGMGPGVYPKAKWPRYPAHPHCHCPQSKVYAGRVPPERDNVQAGGKAALAGMTESQRRRLLTIRGEQGFQGGADWQQSLRHWESGAPAMSQGAKAVLAQVQGQSSPIYTKSKTVPEVESAIKALGVKRVSLNGMALHEANEVARALHRLIKIEGMPAVPEIGLHAGKGGLCRMFSPDGVDGTWVKFGTEALTPGEWEKSRKSANAMNKAIHDHFISQNMPGDPPARRYFVSDGIYDTAIHEYGHWMHGMSAGTTPITIAEDLPGYEILTGRKSPVKSAAWDSIQPKLRESRERLLSEYAGRNVLETFAEAFNAKYSKGEVLPDELERLVNAVVGEAGSRARALGPFQPWSLRKAP